MIQRIRSYTKEESSRDSRKIYFICEGDNTEPEYFEFFRRIASNLTIIPVPSEDGKTDPVSLYEWVDRNILCEKSDYDLIYKEQDVVWFVVDTDKWQEQGKIDQLYDYCKEKNLLYAEENGEAEEYGMWRIAQSNPMFELWYYYHVYEDMPLDEEVTREPSFKEYVNSKISGGYDVKVHPVYLEDAIVNAKRNYSLDAEGCPNKYSTDMFKVGEFLLPFVKIDLRRLRNKVSV